METFAVMKQLVENPAYLAHRRHWLSVLTDDMIDAPLIDIIKGFNQLPYCFTLQSCYGHFVYHEQQDSQNLEPLPVENSAGQVHYRIAYIAFCFENSLLGKGLLEALQEMTAIDPENVQFWERQINSYALQVEPDRFKRKDSAMLAYKEALHIEKIRNEFFFRLYELLKNI